MSLFLTKSFFTDNISAYNGHLGDIAVKKKIFALLSLVLSLCFCLSGCNLFIENTITKANQIAVEAGNITLTREELIKGYSNYYNTFYNNNNNNADAAMKDLIEYLITKKVYISKTEELIKSGEIDNLTDTEKNYIWYSVYTAIINNIETFEKEVKDDLNIKEDKEDEIKKESNFVYTPYTKISKIVYNETSGEYEIQLVKTILVETVVSEQTGERKYEYVSEEESINYSLELLLNSDYIKTLINNNKLYENKTELTTEEKYNKNISRESIRRYFFQLKENEKGKNLSIDDASIFEREIDRIYKIVYENLLVNKLYSYLSSTIDISEEDVLNRYIEKVKSSYERYLLDEDAFTTELTKTVGIAKQYAGYSTESNCIEDVYYVPIGEEGDETYFFINHIVIKLTEAQVQKINELKQYCEINGLDIDEENGYYQTEFNKIVDKTQIKLDERDKEGYVVVKSTDDDAISVAKMLENLDNELKEIDNKYALLDGTADEILTLSGLSEKNYYLYLYERADKFNEYIYKYSDDSGTLQIQSTITGKTNENWYVYALGTDETDSGFVDNFVDTARELNTAGIITEIKTTLMESWSTDEKTGVKTLNVGSTGYSTIIYCGQIQNLFECFNDKKFSLNDLMNEEIEDGKAKYYSLLKMDYQRLGLTMNKTLFDLIYEECYDELYENIITEYKDSILDEYKIITHTNVYSDLLK